MNAEKIGAFKKDEFKTCLLQVIDMSEISLDAVKNRIQYIDNLLESFVPPPSEGDFLLIVRKGKPRSWFTLLQALYNIGREESSDIVLEDPKVSRSHCQIRQDGSNWLLVDKKSQNGIFINGRKMTERILCEGDIVRIGTYELIYINNNSFSFK